MMIYFIRFLQAVVVMILAILVISVAARAEQQFTYDGELSPDDVFVKYIPKKVTPIQGVALMELHRIDKGYPRVVVALMKPAPQGVFVLKGYRYLDKDLKLWNLSITKGNHYAHTELDKQTEKNAVKFLFKLLTISSI